MSDDDRLVGELYALVVELATGAAARVRTATAALTAALTAAPTAAGRSAQQVGSKSTPTDLVTATDRAIESWLVAQLAHRRHDDAVLAEEGSGDARSATASRVRWVLDPIDGTVNFVLGLPQYAVSVAAELDGEVVVGAVADPVSGETFHARTGTGAWLRRGADEQRLAGPRAVPLERAVVGTGFAYDAGTRSRQAEVAARLLPMIGDIRRLGAASLDLCFVAAGRLDAYFEAGLHLWDHAAGGLVAREAGCLVTGLRVDRADDRFVLAAAPGLGRALRDALSDLDADLVRTHE